MSQTPVGPQSEAGDVGRPPYLADYDEYGRGFGRHKHGKYIFPVDEGERRRMDLVQKVFLMVKGGLEYEFPAAAADAAKILDLGSGTSIWACQMAERYPNAHVMAVDLHNSSPRMIPPNVEVKQHDLEDPDWSPLMMDCDMAHIRLLLGAIETDMWPRVYQNVFRHLKPGYGFIEQTEIDWRPGFEHERPQPSSALEEWCEGVLSGLERANRSAHIRPGHTRRMLAEAGFEHIEQVVVRLYLSPSPAAAADDQRELSKWFNLVVTQGFEAMALVPMIRYGSAVDPDQIEDLAQRATTEACTLKYGAYMNAYIWRARRPLGT
ncbi:methyl transferase [Emericellopsis atlantica]|uniref:Methyl transferase n=1 Tax=Emericellopsis atlantica TaxID=2614577 RepID=A0A9P7ZPN2_9HYPO|nr:methyl transferase [Emericellopsis atlantica]KAG9255968.1 methyl transferase [Emericellopsis atlantica]